MRTLKRTQSSRSRWIAWALMCLLPTAVFAADRNLGVSKPAAPAGGAERRVALVIGNGAYDVAPLRNPGNDARAIAQALRESGFQVTERHNLTQSAMREVIRIFGDDLRKGGVGLFYYAGHGMQVKGRNYLIPIRADIRREDEVADQAVSADVVLQKMDAAKNRLNIVILDACRNNPFARSFRSSSQGLAQMDAPSGTLLAYATAPGSVAADGAGQYGLYTQHLLASIRQPGLKIEDVFKRVRVNVKRDSNGLQIPWENTSLEGDFFFRYGKPGQAAPAADSPPVTVASIEPALKPPPAPVIPIGPIQTWTEPTLGMEFVQIPKGCFLMGSPDYETGRTASERQHEVCVEGFWMGKYEVTLEQYKKFYRDHTDNHSNERVPVAMVSWYDAVRFANWLSDKSGHKFRLPSEAEWEYAARAGTSTAYFWGDDFSTGCQGETIYAHCGKPPLLGRMPVGSYKPNAFGLHDMLGNVWEWTASIYDPNYGGKELRSSDAGSFASPRVNRGGTWYHSAADLRAARRSSDIPNIEFPTLGFRLVRSP